MDMSNEVQGTVDGRNDRVARGAALTERDKQIVAYVAIARYLSTAQLHRLAFPGRSLPPCRRRLLRLAGLWKTAKPTAAKAGVQENFVPAYLRRREYRTFAGEIVEVWALTDAGYLLAELVLKTPLRVPRGDVSADFLEHSVILNEVLVGMVDPTLQPCRECQQTAYRWVPKRKDEYVPRCPCGRLGAAFPRAERLAFRWSTSDSTRLPWTEYDMKRGKNADRVIQPDAVLEIAGKRLFLECETGSHSIVGNDEKKGATVAKARRYFKFMNGQTQFQGTETYYSRTYPDRLPADVVFLVPDESRKKNIVAAFEQLRREGSLLRPTILTMKEAPAVLLGVMSPLMPGTAEVTIEDVHELNKFYSSVVSPIKRARAEARAAGTALPDYPIGTEEARRIIQRIADAITGRKPGPAAV